MIRGLALGLAAIAVPIFMRWLSPWPYLLFVGLIITAGVALRRALGEKENGKSRATCRGR